MESEFQAKSNCPSSEVPLITDRNQRYTVLTYVLC
jgi:hypothetical protein